MSFKSRLVPVYMIACRWVWFFLIYAFRLAYFFRVRMLRAKARRGDKIEVLFLVAVTSKWKCQSLFEAMKKSNKFHPRVAVTLQRRELEEMKPAGDLATIRARVETDMQFFERLDDEVVLACNVDKIELLNLCKFNPDIVFYQEPGAPLGIQRVPHMGWHSLCCYVPYSIEVGSDNIKSLRQLHWHPDFHKLMHLIVQWSESKAKDARKGCPGVFRAGSVVGLGHPCLDSLCAGCRNDESDGSVIYAPHYAFPVPGRKRAFNIGTILMNGRTILEYAKRHPEIKWVFKPHPLLASTLVDQGGWSKYQVDEYYKEWETFGIGCYDGSYPELFRRSKAMITDSASFLTEYPITGKPIIHLMLPDVDFSRNIPDVRALFESYYRADNEKDMLAVFKMVLEDGKDPKRYARLRELNRLGVVGVNAAANILEYLKREFGMIRD